MLFDTPVYFIFLVLVVLCYWRLGWRQQNILLLVASYCFYGWWDYHFLSLIAISTMVDYYCACSIQASNDPARRKLLLSISVCVNIGFLGFFKYFNFFADSLSHVLPQLGVVVSIEALQILLPPGISFYTFQALAYIVDVYYERLRPARSLLDYALFISLFPHLIAGPIQRPCHLLPQVQSARLIDPEQWLNGLVLIASGLFRKCVVADNCGLLADGAFGGKLGERSLPVLAIGTYAFAWQIYGDFSGYSNIARGSAQLLGFHFMVNFRQPYLASSFQDFWRRWHISLSTWLRDYVYIPLGGSREGSGRMYQNLFATMLVGGFWHGANWTYVVWGAIHGALLSVERYVSGLLGLADTNTVRLHLALKRVVIFHLVCLGWVFFRSETIGAAYDLLYGGVTVISWRPEYGTAVQFLVAFAVPLFVIDLINERRGEEYLFATAHPYVRTAVAVGFVVATLCFAGSKANAFIYFQF